MSETVSWIGCGRVARTLANALRKSGYKIGVLYSLHKQNVKAAIKFIGAGEIGNDLSSAVNSGTFHFIATNDDAIPDVIRGIVNEYPGSLENHYFFHTSGAISSDILEPLKQKGAEIGSIHPLQVFADPEKALEMLPGTYYAIEGTDRAMTAAIQMIDKLQGKLLLIPTGRKVLYHVAGVFAANYLTAVVSFALNLMEDIGEDREEAYQALLPLMVGALENIEELGIGQALTGPIARGDTETIRTHMKELRKVQPEILDAYAVLGREALAIALRAGRLSADKGRQLAELLNSATEEE